MEEYDKLLMENVELRNQLHESNAIIQRFMAQLDRQKDLLSQAADIIKGLKK